MNNEIAAPDCSLCGCAHAQLEGRLASIKYLDVTWCHDSGSCPTVSLLSAPDLAGSPLAQLATAGLDVLHDEGMAYARRLAAAGVAVGHHNFEQEPHGFLSLGALSLTADGARQQLIKELAG